MMRLGSIEFINSLPVDLGLLNKAVRADAVRVIQGVPSVLNRQIIQTELEISPVSAFWYALHQKELLLLPDLSISSESGVQSVLLFSRHPFRELTGQRIGLTGEGRTTPALLEILCRSKYGFTPQWIGVDPSSRDFPKGLEAVLLIGDRALISKRRWAERSWRAYDLAEEWRHWTGLPIVFAVWAVRKDVFFAFPDRVNEIHRALLESKAWGLSHLDEVLHRAEEKTGLSREMLAHYFSGLSYEFGKDLKQGMTRYFEEAARCGLLEGFKPFEEIREVACTS